MKKTDNAVSAILAKLIYSPEYILQYAPDINAAMFGTGIAFEIADKVLTGHENKSYYSVQQFQDEYPEVADQWLLKPASATQLDSAIDYLRTAYESNEVTKIMQHGYQLAKDGEYIEAQTRVEGELEILRSTLTRKDTKKEAILSAIEYAARLGKTKPGDRVVGVETGFTYLNSFTAGWQPKTMNVIAARPGIGKTTVCCQNAVVAALKGTPVIYFTAGDAGAEMIYFKMACIMAKVNPSNMRHNHVTDAERKKVHEKLTDLYDLPIKVFDTGSFNGKVSGISNIVRRDALNWPQTGLVVVDYIQQIAPEKTTNNRVEDIRVVSAGLQRLSKLANCPVLVASQLSRGMEKEKRYPVNSDLRGSGDIEQDADMILFLVRRPDDDQPVMFITKDRQGGDIPTELELKWMPDWGRYEQVDDVPIATQFPVTAMKANKNLDDVPF
jgi:replicative DNA helicase